ncbi:MAG: hypothetical protein HZB23_01460 [Deltaproteobacteria bacterium]|nr:hypothetical protein [Deltaproteobacteria bacterium]
MEKRFGVATETLTGQTGDFEVMAESAPVFSKRSLGRFPLDGEVESALVKLLSQKAGDY